MGGYAGKLIPPGTSLRSYGPNRRIALEPVSGQALKAKQSGGRAGLEIHAGDPAAPGAPGLLRPTEGCVRLSNANMAALLDALGTSWDGAVEISQA